MHSPRLAPFALVLLVGCTTQPTAPAKAPPQAEPAPATQEDCLAVSKLICASTGEESTDCTASKRLLAVMPLEACRVARSGSAQIEAQVKARLAAERQVCTTLATRLCRDIGETTETCAMITSQTENFPAERCANMLDRYDDVLVDVQKLEASNAPLSAEQQAQLTAGNVPTFGSADAKVVLVEFSDFQCPYCARAAEVLSKLRTKYATQVKFVSRQFPLSFHDKARLAAEAALAAHAQGKFWEMHDAIFSHQEALDRTSIEGYATELGLNMVKFRRSLDDNTYKSPVDEDLALGMTVLVQGTPTWFLNGKRVTNPTDLEAVTELIEGAL